MKRRAQPHHRRRWACRATKGRAAARPRHRRHPGLHGGWWLSFPSRPFTCDFRGVLECQNIMRTCAAIVKPRAAAAWGYMRTSHVQSVHLSYRIASAGHGTGRDDAVDFRKILGRQRNVRGAPILLKVLARFRAGYRDDEDPRTRALGHWPSNRALGERAVLP